MSLQSLVANSKTHIHRAVKIKRRLTSTGLYESDWQDITSDVIRFGSVKRSIDDIRLNKFRLSGTNLTLQNHGGKYNPESYESSFWYGYLARPRTLVKIEAGYKDSIGGTVLPTDPTIFTGIIADEMPISDKNTVVMPCKSLLQIFQEYPASALTGFWTVTGLTAQKIIEGIRDQTDGSNNYIFQPFISSAAWNIQTTTATYDNLNTSSAKELKGLSTWDFVERLAEAENYVSIISPTGEMYFTDRTVDTATSWEFYGIGSGQNRNYGHTIKKINKFYEATNKLYQHVSMRYSEDNTHTSWIETLSALEVSPTNAGWIYGIRTYDFTNYWTTYTQAVSLVNNIFSDYSTVKNEINFTSLLIPHLDILSYSEVSYESYELAAALWDVAKFDVDNWESSADNFQLQSEPFKIISIQHNLDNFESKWIMRES